MTAISVSRRIRIYHQPVAVGLVLLGLLIFWNLQERKHSRELGLREARQSTHSVTDAVEASAQALVRRGHLDVQRIRMLLENVVAATDVTFVSLQIEGEPPLSAGAVPDSLPRLDDHGGQLVGRQYIHWETVRLQDSPLPYRHRYPEFSGRDDEAEDRDLSDQDQRLVLGMLAEGYFRHVDQASRRLDTLMAVGVLCLLGLSGAWMLSIRNRELGRRLGEARLREEHLDELEMTALGLAHETKNPLGLVRGLAQRIAGEPGVSDSVRDKAAAIMEQADTAASRLGDFLAYARPRPPHPQPVAAQELVQRICALLEPEFTAAGVNLSVEGPDFSLLADPDQIEQVLVNLLLNSLQASPAGTRVSVRVAWSGAGAMLTVADEGSGIAPEVRPDLFKPYVSGRSDGHGLGLAIVRRIADAHGWSLTVESPADPRSDRGTSIAIGGLKPAPPSAELEV